MRDVIASPAGPIEVAPRQLEGPRAIAYGAVLALGGIAIGLNLVHLIDLVVTSAERILHGVGAWWYGPSLLAGGLTAWIGGTLLAGVLVFQIALRGAGSLALRALFALLGLGLLGELGAGLFFAFRPGATPEALVVSELLISALGALVSLPLALGVLPRRRLGAASGLGAASLLVIGMLSLGWGAIVEAWLDSLPQSFPRLRITLVAARHAQPADKGARVVTVGTRRYVLDPANRLELTEVDLRRVRLTSHGAPAGQTVLVIRLRRASANTLRDRSLRALRGGPFGWSCDAIYVNGQLVMVPIYREVIADGRLQITDNDRRSLERLHTILTGKSSR